MLKTEMDQCNELAANAVAILIRKNCEVFLPVTVADILNPGYLHIQESHGRLRVRYVGIRAVIRTGHKYVGYPVEVYLFSGAMNGRAQYLIHFHSFNVQCNVTVCKEIVMENRFIMFQVQLSVQYVQIIALGSFFLYCFW